MAIKIPAFGSAGNLINVIREVDVHAIREAAEAPFVIAFISRDMPLAEHLADLMYQGARDYDLPMRRTCAALPFNTRLDVLQETDIVVLIARDGDANDNELRLVRELTKGKTQVLVCLLHDAAKPAMPPSRQRWLPANVIVLNTPIEDKLATDELVKNIRAFKKVDDLALARHLPAFREPVARAFIEDVANANAAYSFSTGLLEVVPIANIPLNAADILVLTKNQAVLAYKIAVSMGLETDFKEIMPKLAAVLGGGFIFRQAARSLVGLLPGLGLLPKVAVAFAGTYATGEAILRWCINGEHMNAAALKDAYEIALARGKAIAQSLWDKRKLVKPPKALAAVRP